MILMYSMRYWYRFPALLSVPVFVAICLFTPKYAAAQSLPQLAVSLYDTVATLVSLNKNGVVAFPETTPWIVRGGWRGYYLSTDYTYFCATPDSLASSSVSLRPEYCAQVSARATSTPWLRNYGGVFSAYVKDPGTDNPLILAAIHGENKNERLYGSGLLIQNTVDTDFTANPKFDAHTCASGYSSAGVYSDCDDAYNGFVSLAHEAFTPATQYARQPMQNDGPIVWPADGYVKANGSKASMGVRHPTFFSDGTYLYVFYLDMSPASWGIKVARAPLASMPASGGFKVYDGTGFNTSALPAGFSRDAISSFYASRGGASVCVIACVGFPTRFSVARVNGTNSSYVGVLEYIATDGQARTQLAASDDLVHWTEPVTVHWTPGWASNDMHYPVLMDTDGWTNTAIDIDDFYVVGVSGAAETRRIHISARLTPGAVTVIKREPEPAPNPPTLPVPSAPPAPSHNEQAAPAPSVPDNNKPTPAATTTLQAATSTPSLLSQILSQKGFRVPALVRTTDNVNARVVPAIGTVSCVSRHGSIGITIDGPSFANGRMWWKVYYLGGCMGWSVQDYLETGWWLQ